MTGRNKVSKRKEEMKSESGESSESENQNKNERPGRVVAIGGTEIEAEMAW